MTLEKMLKLAKNHLKTAILLGLLTGALSFLLLVMTQKSFRSSTDVLVSQNQPGVTDYYSLSQSANYLTTVLSQSIYSEKFLDDVIALNKVSASFVSGDSASRLKKWQHVVKIKNNPNVGIMSIEIFGDTQNQTSQISDAVLDVLANKNSFFLGQDQNVNVRILSGPITEKNPSLSQIALTSVGGFLLGSLLYVLFLIYREEISGEKEFEERIEREKRETQIYPLENFPQEKNVFQEKSITDEDYLSANSDYWKEKLNNHSVQ